MTGNSYAPTGRQTMINTTYQPSEGLIATTMSQTASAAKAQRLDNLLKRSSMIWNRSRN